MIADDEVLIEALAEKLGILVKRDNGDKYDLEKRLANDRDPDMKRFFGAAAAELADSDNDWSDSDDEIGNTENGESNTSTALLQASNERVASELPQTHGQANEFAKKKRRDKKTAETIGGRMEKPRNVPRLKLGEDDEINDKSSGEEDEDEDMMKIEKHVKGKGWRRLHKAKLAPNVFDKITKTRYLASERAKQARPFEHPQGPPRTFEHPVGATTQT